MLGRGLIINLIWILHEVSCRHHPNPIKRIEPGLRMNKIIDRNHVNIDFTLPGARGFSDTMTAYKKWVFPFLITQYSSTLGFFSVN